MKAKTKNQLREEILTLQVERVALEKTLKDTRHKIIGILEALGDAVGATLVHSPNAYESSAALITSFFAEIKRITGLDFTENIEYLTRLTGFDEATITVIKQRIQPFFEISKMVHEGKSEKELQAFAKKLREAEGRK